MNDTSKTPRPARKWRWLLGVSLALNLAFVGLVAGAFLRDPGPRGGGKEGAQMRSFGLPYVRSLAPAQRRQILAEVQQEGHLQNLLARRAAYAKMVEVVRTTPFDQAAAAAVLEQQNAVLSGAQSAAQAAWLRIVAEMSDADRALYADRLMERLEQVARKKR